jgi:hypothetical protein
MIESGWYARPKSSAHYKNPLSGAGSVASKGGKYDAGKSRPKRIGLLGRMRRLLAMLACCFLVYAALAPALLALSSESDCADHHKDCPAWATSGECEKNPEWMRTSCAQSCG